MRQGSRRRLPGLAARTGMLAWLVLAPLAPAGGSEELPAPERHQAALGGLVVKTCEVEGYPWPEVTVDRQVAASPEEVMAVSADVASHADDLPHLVYSRMVERLARTSCVVDDVANAECVEHASHQAEMVQDVAMRCRWVGPHHLRYW